MKHYFFSLCLILLASKTNAQEWIDNAEFDRQIVINNQGRFGYVEKIWRQDIKKARLLIPYQFNWAGPFDKAGHAVVEVSGKYGLIDTLGKYVIPASYDYVYSFSNGLATVYKDGKFGAVNTKGVVVIPIEYDFLSAFTEAGRADAVKGNKWGVINSANTALLPFQYLVAGTDDKGYTRAFSNNWGYFDPAGKPVLDESYQALSHEGNGYVVGYLTTLKKVLMNTKWEKVLPDDLAYDELHKSGNPCIVKKGDHYGLFDLKAKKLILPAEYSSIYFEGSDMLRVAKSRESGPYYFADLKGNKLFGKEFQEIREFDYASLAEVKQNNKWGLIDKKGNWILPCEMGSEKESTININAITGRISARNRKGWGMTDLKGNIVLPFQYIDPLESISAPNPFYFFGDCQLNDVKDKLTGKEGIVDNKGAWFFAPGNNTYDEFGIISSFISGGGCYVPVAKNGKWGVYDLASRKEVIPLKLDDINSGVESAHVDFLDRKKEKWGLVLFKSGKIYKPDEYEYVDYDEEANYLTVQKNRLKGLMDVNGKTITPVIYEALNFDSESGYYFAGKNGMAGFINQQGNMVIPFNYDPPPGWQPNVFVNGHVLMKHKGKRVLLDSKGKTIIKAADFKGPDEIFIVRSRFSGNTWCYMGKHEVDGEEIVKIIVNGLLYENLGGDIFNTERYSSVLFKEGLLAVKRNGLYGYLDRNGNEVIPFEYQRASSFEDGTAYVKKDGKYFKINRNGQRLKYADMRLAILARDKK